jgi:iron complex transport system ATP-binding protein
MLEKMLENMLEIKNLSARYGSAVILDNVSFSAKKGRWIMIAGPNGAGKSTLINCVSQGAPYEGEILFEGGDVSKMRPDILARNIGVLAQNHYVGYSFAVEDIVRLGRYAYRDRFFSQTKEDDEKVEEALRLTGLLEFRAQSATTLSGGELQRVFLAQALAQNPKLLLLDEPTNHLDLVFQKQIFELISEWIKESDRAVISVVHDLNLAKKYGNDAILMENGRIIAAGDAERVFSPENLNRVYKMDVCAWMCELLEQWA